MQNRKKHLVFLFNDDLHYIEHVIIVVFIILCLKQKN